MRTETALLMGLLASTMARAQMPDAPTAPVDYADPATWICRPGAVDPACSRGLDVMAVTGAGVRTPQPYRPAASPPIDCFYVYPTTSDDRTVFSDMTPDASERRTVHAQAARLGQVCRLFAPAYRQLTSEGLRRYLKDGQGTVMEVIDGVPYRDVRDAWRSYMTRDNRGRGVVLVGHSQGSIILKKLLAEEIDGKPAQARLVGAYLAGNPDLDATSFHAVAPCRAIGQTGCLVAWSSYADGDGGTRVFGRTRGHAPVCVNPAALGGGRGMLKPILPRPAMAPEGDPPSVEALEQVSAECVADDQGAVLRIRVEPGRYAGMLGTLLGPSAAQSDAKSNWGLHGQDIRLAQGTMLDLIAAQSAAWAKAHPGR